MRAVSVGYRLAPEHPYPATLQDVTAAYRALVEQPGGAGHVVVSGESAGGNLAIELLIAGKAERLPMPAAALLLSPMTDLTVTGGSYAGKAHADPVITAQAIRTRAADYLAGTDPADPLVSPIFADLSGLPPLNRGIESEVLPVTQRHGIGVVVWSPLAQGLLTGRVRSGQQTDLRRTAIFSHMRDERRLDAVEKVIPLADEAGLPMTRLAMAFAIAHPGVTSALIGPRTMEHLDDLLAGLDVKLTDDILDQIDEIVPPGTDVGTLDMAYRPPALQQPDLRRHPAGERSAAA